LPEPRQNLQVAVVNLVKRLDRLLGETVARFAFEIREALTQRSLAAFIVIACFETPYFYATAW